MMITRRSLVWMCALWLTLAVSGSAQEPDATPAFSIASSHVFNTRERATISLTYRRVERLDFRVYRVSDPFAFFAKLRDPHQLGSETPVVPQERTWLERIAFWKARRRSDVRAFVRAQFTHEYRQARRAQQDAQQVVQRQTINASSFAQVPLLNASQLVTSWREILPPVRDPEYRRVPLDLPGPGVYVVEAVAAPLRAYTVVIISDVGLVTKAAPGQLLVYAANRFSSDPLPECHVQVLIDQKLAANGTTSADGTYETPMDISASPDHVVTVAQCGTQVAATDPGAYTLRQPSRNLVGYVYTDRPVYRPGHQVRYKAVLRWRDGGAILPFDRQPVEVSVTDTDQKVLVREKKTPDEFGSVNGSLTIPAAASLGFYSIRVTRGDQTAGGSFDVQEYRKPEYDVAVRIGSKFTLQGKRLAATIAARYYFGQPVAGGSVEYVVQRQPYYSPLRDDGDGDGGDNDGGWYGGDEIFQGKAKLNDQGTADVSIQLPVDDHGRDYMARIEARVTDASAREVSGASFGVATYGSFMLAARTERYIYSSGETANVEVRAVDYQGAAQSNVRVRMVLDRVEYRSGDTIATKAAEADIDTSAEGRASWAVKIPTQPGNYRITASAPSQGRRVTTQTSLWIPGPTQRVDSDYQFLELVADKKTYQPGDTARVIIKGAEFAANVLITKEHQRVAYHRVVATKSNEAVDVPIVADDVGDTYVSVAFVKDDRMYRAEHRLSVPATRHQLTVTATADRPVVRPGQPGTYLLHVVNADGTPVRAQVSVGVVDEAVYGVRRDSTPDPLRFFHRREYAMVSTDFSRDYPFVGYSGTDQLLLARRHRPFTLADFKADRPDRPRVRKDFPDTIYWAPDVTTDADGNARVTLTYPDSLTTWRLTARAVTVNTDVGTTTANTISTKDLILRVVTPRFLTEGDQVSIPTIVHNYLPDTASVNVSLSADGLQPAAGANTASPSTVRVPSNGQERIDWRYVANQVRPVTLTGQATSDAAGDAMQTTLPVLPAGLQRNAGTSGSLVDVTERTMELAIPPTANESARTVRISLAPSLAGTMLSALDYLTSYPWGCTEQTLSSFVPNLAVLRSLEQLKVAPTERLQSLNRQVTDGLKRLYDYQHDDGGWGWWKTDQNHPFMTAYALDGLLQARDNGANVDVWRINNAKLALTRLYAQYPRAIPDLKAYELYALARASVGGDPASAPPGSTPFDLAAARSELWSSRDRMTTSGRALLLMTLDLAKDSRGDQLAREIVSAAETKGDVSWWAVARDPLLDDLVDTSVEASALSLKALAARDPHNPLLERVARWLVLNRSAGAYWISTKQTALALQGLLAFMQARGEQPAPVAADVFVNGTRVNTTSFDANALTAPNPVRVESPANAGSNAIRIVKRGAGAVYYDAGVRYYDKPAASERTGSRHLALTRSYALLSPVEKNGRILYHENPFTGTARPGDLILVRLNAAGSPDWRYLMLEDPIPAGTEPVTQESSYDLEQPRRWFWGANRELRDDRVVFFLDDFSAGHYELTYMLKVTTPGVFSAMPAHIAPMYVPDASASSDVIKMTVATEPGR